MKTQEQEIQELKNRILEYENGTHTDQIIRTIALNSPSNIMVLDLEAHIQYINHTVPGITPEEMKGQYLPELVEEHFRSRIIDALERVAKSGEPDRYEVPYRSPVGDISWWESGIGPVLQGAKITGYVIVSTNVTEQHRQREEQERFFNLSVDMMCVGGFDGYFKRVNQAFRNTLGYDKELLERPIFEFIHPEDLKATENLISGLLKGDVVKGFNNRYLTSDGNYRLLSWQLIADQNTEAIYGVARDITDTTNLENQLQQSRKIEAIGQLAGGIAHDFNNLLTAIQINIELAQQAQAASSVPLQNAIEAVGRASALTQQLLIFSRHKALSPEDLQLNPLLNNLMNLLERLLPENISISLEQNLDAPLILADKSQVEQMIINLCVNARDAMPDGGLLKLAVKKVIIDSKKTNTVPVPSGEYLELSITDTGCGMSADEILHIFEPFYTTKDVGKGTGLGLATVYGIVQKHQGYIDVDSKIGKGTTFRVYLPATNKPQTIPLVAVQPDSQLKGGSETILLAEDDPMVCAVVTHMLTQAGYKVIAGSDGQDALELFKLNKDQISLALLDVVMPVLGGLDTAEKLRELCPELKIIFTSGYVQNEQDPERLEKETFLPKPFERKTLLNCIRQKLGKPD